MKLSNLLHPDFIFIGDGAKTKDEAIDKLFENLASKYKRDADWKYVRATIDEREKLGGTSFGSGIAIPHARLDNFDDTVISVLIPKTPMHNNSDGTNVSSLKIVVLILTSKTVSSVYLNTLAALIKLSRNKEQFEKVLQSADSGDFIKKIEQLDIRVKDYINVGNIMEEEFISVSPDNTIKELADILYANKLWYVPVTDKAGNLIGEATLKILIKEGIPDYASQFENLNFLKTFEPLERLFLKEDEIKVSDIMKKPSVIFDCNTSIVEASMVFVKTGRSRIPVVEDNKVVGVLALIDILNRVLRG